MLSIKNSRYNLQAFLHMSDIAAIQKLSNNLLNPDKLCFYSVCDSVIDLYKDKQITNKQATNIFNILMMQNTMFKKEQFRQDGYNNILRYSVGYNAYLFYCNGGNKELNKLIEQYGEYE